MTKKEIRKKFRDDCHRRDKYKCVTCGYQSSPAKAEDELDVHHIVNRKEMPNGGYVKENGISLCESCHLKAEEFHANGIPVPGYSIEELFVAIKSSLDEAIKASERL